MTVGTPTPVNMVRADLRPQALHRWAGSRRLAVQNAFDPGFAIHTLLVESFGDLAPRPFRFIIPRESHMPGVLYGYSPHNADALRNAAAIFADPLQSDVLPPASIQSKTMPASWTTGQQLGFEVLIRPIARRSRGAARPGAEIDVFQREASQHPPGEMTRTREAVYRDWLKTMLENRGADLNEARLRSFQRVQTIRRLGQRTTEGPEALIQGTLTVIDASAFADLIARGVGRHRSYGYGMLLVRPPRGTNR